MQEFESFENRRLIGETEARELQRQGLLSTDPERTLPLWFDGRYLASIDLTREQNYFLARQAAIGKSIGRGVIEGLGITVDAGATIERARLTIGAGQGIAFDGAHVILPEDLSFNLADIEVQDGVNVTLGLSANPGAPLRSRTGLFVLALRPVEYTANQTTAFPTTVTGERTTHHGDRIEAVAVTLTPYAPNAVPLDSRDARTMAERRIFLTEEEAGLPGFALPLAMLSLRNGGIEWVDVHLVRRELVASKRDLLGLGLARDQLRLAHFHQYRAALADVVADYRNQGQPPQFSAGKYFHLLPPAGQLPAAAINASEQTQIFFPSEFEVELSIIPEDELPALIDDSFELPPIDLTRTAEERDSLSVMVLAPLPRDVLQRHINELNKLTRPMKPASVVGQVHHNPTDMVGGLFSSLADAPAGRTASDDGVRDLWAMLIGSLAGSRDGGATMLWYVRRRTLADNVNLESALAAVGHLDVGGDEIIDPDAPVPIDPPDNGGATPTTEPDPLSPEARATLLRLSGLGDLAAMVEAEMLRVNDDVRAVFLDGLNAPTVAPSPLATTALTARLSLLRANEINNAREAAQAIAGANPLGMSLLGIGLVGEIKPEVSEARFEQLFFFNTNEDMLEQTAKAAAKLDARVAADMIATLAKAIDVGSEEGVNEAVRAMLQAVDRPGGGAPSASGDLAAAEAEARARADAFIATLPDDGQRRAMSRLLGNADPVARDALVTRLAKADVAGSRIAVGAVLARLERGGRLRVEQLGQIKIVDQPFVEGLKAIEPLILEAETGQAGGGNARRGLSNFGLSVRDLMAGPTLPISNAVFDATAIANAFVNARRTPTEQRLQLLASSPVLPALATFGREATAARRRSGAKRIVEVLDSTNANAAMVKAVIVKISQGSPA